MGGERPRRPALGVIIRQNLRNASMTGPVVGFSAFEGDATGRTLGRQRGAATPLAGLESVKKTHQVAAVGPGSGAPCHLNQTAIRRRRAEEDMSLTMAQGMKRLGMPVAVLRGVVLVGLTATSWLINRDALRQAVEAQIRAVTGLELTVKGPIDVSVFPGSYVSFHDVGLKGGAASDPALRVDVLTANLRLLPLLLQRFEIADLMMLRPQIHVARRADGE